MARTPKPAGKGTKPKVGRRPEPETIPTPPWLASEDGHARAEPEKRGPGQPTSYRPEFVAIARAMCELGATDVQLADTFKVSTDTITRWASTHPEFCGALKVGKAAADDLVERSLFQRARGYTFDIEEVFCHQGAIVRAPVRKHVPPDTTAQIFWLKNRRKAEWRDRQEAVNLNADLGMSELHAFLDSIAGTARERLPFADQVGADQAEVTPAAQIDRPALEGPPHHE